MLLMSKPEPMPVEEMTVLAVDVAVGVAVEGVVDEIEEAMSLALIPISPYVGKPDQYLSKTRTILSPQHSAVPRPLRVAVEQPAGYPDAAREGRGIARLRGCVSGRLGRSLAAGRQRLAAAFLNGDGYLRLTSVH
jgi:hypothetical protein